MSRRHISTFNWMGMIASRIAAKGPSLNDFAQNRKNLTPSSFALPLSHLSPLSMWIQLDFFLKTFKFFCNEMFERPHLKTLPPPP